MFLGQTRYTQSEPNVYASRGLHNTCKGSFAMHDVKKLSCPKASRKDKMLKVEAFLLHLSEIFVNDH